MADKTVLLLGAFDTKATEYAFIRNLIHERGIKTLSVHCGVFKAKKEMIPDIDNDEVASAVGSNINVLQEKKDRAMKVIAEGSTKIVKKLYEEGKFNGILGMGGGSGTSIITATMRSLPIGVPKVMVSTMASGNTRNYVGTKDIVMIPSIVDIAGINSISIQIFSEAVGAICGMLEVGVQKLKEEKPVIAVTMFGNTTACVDRAREKLSKEGYEVLVFHATGIGGMTMENLVEEGYIDAVLDITTTEWADEICGGILSAGPTRLEAAGRRGIPHLIVPGCVDMCNFGTRSTVPEKYSRRRLYEWNPNVTLLRTNIEENKKMGKIFAEKANAGKGQLAFLIPLRGVSQLDSEGQPFWWPEADKAMFESIKKNVQSNIPVFEMDLNINDPAFADKAVQIMIKMIKSTHTR